MSRLYNSAICAHEISFIYSLSNEMLPTDYASDAMMPMGEVDRHSFPSLPAGQ